MRPSIVGAGEQLDPRYSMQTYHPPVKQGLHPVVHVANKLYSLHAPSPGGMARLSWPGWLLVTYRDGLPVHNSHPSKL